MHCFLAGQADGLQAMEPTLPWPWLRTLATFSSPSPRCTSCSLSSSSFAFPRYLAATERYSMRRWRWVCCCGMTGTCLVTMACFMSRTPCLVYVGPTAGAAGRPGCRVGRPKCGTLGRSVGGRKAAGWSEGGAEGERRARILVNAVLLNSLAHCENHPAAHPHPLVWRPLLPHCTHYALFDAHSLRIH